ncbi:MAG: acyl-CoA dehydrogenase family protein [Chloroflexi bacterium]|nr:acyl-CoA dehydrogenase family protein [Chloroflexota bacterium]MCI0813600.1 acyl-CoA dehydrogenase family protein [Chloroflexota bacterium]MCI0817490.1 acyl-CoA dehydrogenase family protein [Chloroflexota bacterium]MCI0842800.1 acyl-CoA dehydrogenase family protein [Chloroflexota bacterium]MCI0885063.1 acyl-CoA dehydrogenase family protein [Chloroflexota bacterium]
MDFKLTPDEEAFRDEVRAFAKENLSPEARKSSGFLSNWLKAVREKRWVGFNWPEAYGGGGGGIMKQVILKEEMAKAGAPPLGLCLMGLQWVGPAIIEYGTEEQKKSFLPDILDSKYQWCTGYSEPGFGSDLASLQCKAVRDGDEYVINGQKIWTSIASWSKWMILLTRTDFNTDDKHDGITCLLVEMDSPGIEVRPIKNMAGGSLFSEVFFDNVRVPVENLLGEEGKGWAVTVSALAHERSGISEVAGLAKQLDEVIELAKQATRNGRRASEQPSIRRRLAKADTIIEGMRLNGQRFLTRQLKGEPLSSETSINKLHRAFLAIELGDLSLEILGNASQYLGGDETSGVDQNLWPNGVLDWPTVVIGGGTPNIQRNIIAERILGLPKD